MAVDENIYQHFRKEERSFLDHASDLVNQATNTYAPVLTDFLNDREAYLLETLVNHYPELKLSFDGGHPNAELKRGLIFPDYFVPQQEDYGLSLMKIKCPKKFVTLQHRQVLGTLMGLGLKRNVIGDIFSDGETWQFFAEHQLVDFLAQNINHIGKNTVSLTEIPITGVVSVINDWETEFYTVPSLRLDVILAFAYKLSRAAAKDLVLSGHVKLNWISFDNPNHELQLHDLISVRGYGRIKFNQLNGL